MVCVNAYHGGFYDLQKRGYYFGIIALIVTHVNGLFDDSTKKIRQRLDDSGHFVVFQKLR